MTVTGSILPEGSGSWDLGSPSHPFRDLYITTASIKFVSRATGEVVSELSAQNVKDLKEGKSIKEDEKQIIKGQTISGSLNVTGSTTLIGSLYVNKEENTMRDANIEASSSQLPFLGGTIITYDNSYHHLNVASDFFSTPPFSADPDYATEFVVGNNLLTNIVNFGSTSSTHPEINLLVTSSGQVYIGSLKKSRRLGYNGTRQATLHVSGNYRFHTDDALLIEGDSTLSGSVTLGRTCADDINVLGTITSSCNISTSKTIIAEHFFSSDDAEIADDLTVNSNIYVAGGMYHEGDTNTFIRFTDDHVEIGAGGSVMIEVREWDDATFGPDYVALGVDCNDSILLKGNVTASCNISASGYITASNIGSTQINTETITT